MKKTGFFVVKAVVKREIIVSYQAGQGFEIK